MSSQKLCKACLLLQGLVTSDYSLGVKKVNYFAECISSVHFAEKTVRSIVS